MVKDIEAGRAISSRRNRPDAPLCHGVLHLGCGAYAAVSSQRRPLLGLMHRVHSFLCARYVPPWPAPSITRLTASNDTGACEIYETARPTLLTSALYAIRHFSSLYSLLPVYPAIGLFCIPSSRVSNVLFNVRRYSLDVKGEHMMHSIEFLLSSIIPLNNSKIELKV